VVAGLAVLLTGCRQPAEQQPPKYQISIAPSGQLYRLDVTSGEVTMIEKIPIISDGRVKLVVGSFYETERGDVLRYVGDGRFEPRRPLPEIFK
jgi:hypothetical protein